ncbi:hypothetical protein [Microcoleus sp. FACHB-1515]|uniref:hypothetical protein n=1 Tax=Cyanophyceae TaxID=3028117 RepID=UPI001A7E4385|nr:hypothetical protein [Microcoleus sp. FACHB-1515]
MSLLPNLLQSIFLAALFGFLLPVLVLGGLWGALELVDWLSDWAIVHQIGGEMAQFLSVFGSGHAVRGLIVIGLACSAVGVLLDSYTLYRQSLRG